MSYRGVPHNSRGATRGNLRALESLNGVSEMCGEFFVGRTTRVPAGVQFGALEISVGINRLHRLQQGVAAAALVVIRQPCNVVFVTVPRRKLA